MEKRYLAMWMWLCEGKFKGEIAHFLLPSALQKRACFKAGVHVKLVLTSLNTAFLGLSANISVTFQATSNPSAYFITEPLFGGFV